MVVRSAELILLVAILISLCDVLQYYIFQALMKLWFGILQ